MVGKSDLSFCAGVGGWWRSGCAGAWSIRPLAGWAARPGGWQGRPQRAAGVHGWVAKDFLSASPVFSQVWTCFTIDCESGCGFSPVRRAILRQDGPSPGGSLVPLLRLLDWTRRTPFRKRERGGGKKREKERGRKGKMKRMWVMLVLGKSFFPRGVRQRGSQDSFSPLPLLRSPLSSFHWKELDACPSRQSWPREGKKLREEAVK